MRADDVMLKPSVLLLKVWSFHTQQVTQRRLRLAQVVPEPSGAVRETRRRKRALGIMDSDRWSLDLSVVGAIKSESFCGGK